MKNSVSSKKELLELQQRFREGKIKDGDLSQEQINALCDLYDEQIRSLRISIDMRKLRIEEHRNKKKRV